jgi:AcrR family transcriptional regulator
MPARMKAAARRLQILETAARCFAEHGYRGTTTAMLAKEAGITEPILYRHFANKHDLFIALIESVGEEVFSNRREAIRNIPSPLGQLRAILYRNPATADPVTRRVYRVIFHASAEFTEPQIQDAIREHYRKYLRFLSKIVHKAQEAGEVRKDVTAEMLAWQIIHAAVGFAMVRLLDIPGHGTAPFVDETIRLILELLSPLPDEKADR